MVCVCSFVGLAFGRATLSIEYNTEPPGGLAFWRSSVVDAGKGYDSAVAASTDSLRESRGRYLFVELLSRDVIKLVETKRFAGDPAWGELLGRLNVGACTVADQRALNTRVVANLPKTVQAKMVLAPLITSFNAEVQVYNEDTAKLITTHRGDQVCIVRCAYAGLEKKVPR